MKFTVFILWHFVKFWWRYDGERFCAAKHDGAGRGDNLQMGLLFVGYGAD